LTIIQFFLFFLFVAISFSLDMTASFGVTTRSHNSIDSQYVHIFETQRHVVC